LTATQIDSVSAKRADLAVLYAEIRGFTRVSAILEPAIVIAGISRFFAMVSAAVERREGVVRSMLNDNLMATFAGPANATHAVEAAQDILRDFTQIEEAWQRDYGFRTAVAMGMHRGDVVVGPSSDKPGAPKLIVGDGVSMAARLLHRARTGEVVLSKAVMDAVDATAPTVDIEKLPALNIPRREPLEIYGVLLDTRLDFTI
jgi:adenylate cyclase